MMLLVYNIIILQCCQAFLKIFFYVGVLASGDIYYFSYITSDTELFKKIMKGDMQTIFNSLCPSESGEEDIEGNP
jgi:hypothetical protein